MLAYVGGALHQSKIPASQELAAASPTHHQDDSEPLPSDVRAALGGLLDACDDDPFAFVSSLAQFGHTLPEEARSTLAARLALDSRSDARVVAVLFLLDSSSAVRRAATAALSEVASSLLATDLRRLIAIRNWRPETERAERDVVVRKARTAGIACARWEAGPS
jgi:hypothetical protein